MNVLWLMNLGHEFTTHLILRLEFIPSIIRRQDTLTDVDGGHLSDVNQTVSVIRVQTFLSRTLFFHDFTHELTRTKFYEISQDIRRKQTNNSPIVVARMIAKIFIQTKLILIVIWTFTRIPILICRIFYFMIHLITFSLFLEKYPFLHIFLQFC